jgi:hypothetical protein
MKAAFLLAVGLVGALTSQRVRAGVFDQAHTAFDAVREMPDDALACVVSLRQIAAP